MIQKHIYIKTTESCNLKCQHCYIGKYRNQYQLFDENKTISWLKSYLNIFKIPEKDILISFHGGEPFLCSLDKIKKVTASFPKANFNATSNLCFNLTQEHIDFIKNTFYDRFYRTPYIKTSWDYKIRFKNIEQYNLWYNNIKLLQSNGIDVTVTICLTSLLIKEVEPSQLLEFFQNLEINSLNFERLTENTTIKKNLIPDYTLQDNYLYELFRLNEERFGFNIILFEDIKRAVKDEIFNGCRKRKCMQEVLTINANGSIGGCPNTALIEPFSFIHKNPLDLIKNQCQQCLIEKENLRHPECYTCNLFQFCNGDCHQLSWQNGICPAPKQIYNYLLPNNKLTTIQDTDDKVIRLLENTNWEYELLKIDKPQVGNIDNLRKIDKPLDFIFPQEIYYKKFKNTTYGKLEGLSYYTFNLPLEYYQNHKIKPNMLFYKNNTWTSSDKEHSQVQNLINNIAKVGFNCPLCFRLCRNGQLYPMACNTRLFIARYLDLPYIPAIILIGGDFDDLGDNNMDYKNFVNKYLGSYMKI